MRFIYRGVKYNREPAAMDVKEVGVGGQYRGQVWQRHIRSEPPAPQPMHHLKYRGVPYTIGEVANPTRPTLQVKVPSGSVLSALMPEVSRLHRANLQRNIERRLEVAKAQGNSMLIAMLEREFDEVIS